MPTNLIFFLFTLTVSIFCQPAHGQGLTKMPHIGYLEPSSEGSSAYQSFERGLLELGYVEGKNIAIEHRSATGRSQYLDFVKELVQLKVDVIVARGGAVRPAKAGGGNIPIVFAYSGDPIEAGFVASFSNPGANLTGVTYLAYELVGKRIELLKEAVPSISVVAVLANPGHAGEKREFSETQRAARALRVDLQYHRVKNSTADFDTAFGAILKEKADALLVFPESVTMAHKKQITEFAAKHRLPSVFGWKEFVEDGGLMSYGPDRSDVHRLLAVYVDKILKGRKPTDLPVELPMKFELVVNLKTAHQIGVTIPQWTLMKADRVIR